MSKHRNMTRGVTISLLVLCGSVFAADVSSELRCELAVIGGGRFGAALAVWSGGSYSVEQRTAAYGPEVVLRDAAANTTAVVLPQAGFNCWKLTVGAVEFLAPPADAAAPGKPWRGTVTMHVREQPDGKEKKP